MKSRKKGPTRDDLSPGSRRFWQQQGLLDKLPIGLLVALDRELKWEAQGWREQILTAFLPEGRRRGRRTRA
jgi:hypothetical protein